MPGTNYYDGSSGRVMQCHRCGLLLRGSQYDYENHHRKCDPYRDERRRLEAEREASKTRAELVAVKEAMREAKADEARDDLVDLLHELRGDVKDPS